MMGYVQGALQEHGASLPDMLREFGPESACKKGETEKEAENRMLKDMIFEML